MSRRLAWVVWLPLAVAPWLGAHCLAHSLVAPGGQQPAQLHTESAHAYLGYSPLVASALTLVLAGLVLCGMAGMRGRPGILPPLGLFAVVPPVGFAVQEHLEGLLASGAFPQDLALEPTFLAGLALQIPFAALALLLTRAVYALGHCLGYLLARGFSVCRLVRPAPCLLLRLPAWTGRITPSVLALGHGQRAPPATSCP